MLKFFRTLHIGIAVICGITVLLSPLLTSTVDSGVLFCIGMFGVSAIEAKYLKLGNKTLLEPDVDIGLMIVTLAPVIIMLRLAYMHNVYDLGLIVGFGIAGVFATIHGIYNWAKAAIRDHYAKELGMNSSVGVPIKRILKPDGTPGLALELGGETVPMTDEQQRTYQSIQNGESNDSN